MFFFFLRKILGQSAVVGVFATLAFCILASLNFHGTVCHIWWEHEQSVEKKPFLKKNKNGGVGGEY